MFGTVPSKQVTLGKTQHIQLQSKLKRKLVYTVQSIFNNYLNILTDITIFIL